MLFRDFPGAERLIARVDAAVREQDTERLTAELRKALCELIRDPSVTLPECVMEPCSEHYARRELYHSQDLGYAIIAMTWGPGQGTLIHDHGGMWCVEGVWHGQLEITQYELREHDEERFRFVSAGSIQAGTGSAGSLIPPHDYHTIRNPTSDSVSVSVHIYSGPMTCCSVFQPQGGEWYARNERRLSVD
jgi:predicted metal-dependent enzyme (double-stranded beta helix superfamily)